MYICLTDPCISCVNNVNPKEQKKNIFSWGGGGGGGASEIRQTWGGACPKRLKTPAIQWRSYGWARVGRGPPNEKLVLFQMNDRLFIKR